MKPSPHVRKTLNISGTKQLDIFSDTVEVLWTYVCVCVCVCGFNESQAMLLQNVQATEAYNPEQSV